MVIVDTAGRLGIDAEMMAQAADIRDAVTPDETLFVVDAMVGQDAVTTARAFQDGVGFSGVVLTKLDGDARGGAALSVRHVTGQPIMFASNGEKLADFDVFHPDRMAQRILGMGDVRTLFEQAEKAFDQDQAEQTVSRLMSQQFTLEDYLDQMQALRRMGPLQNILSMMPGMGGMKEAISQLDERDLDRAEAIIRSMTPAERQDPKLINGSRRLRIANGCGMQVSDVNQLVDRFLEARKMLSQMGGMMGLPGARRKNTKQAKGRKGKKGGRSGRGPTPPRMPAGMGGLPGGFGGGFGGVPPALPPGMTMPDLSKLNLPKQ
jgi:signal recognition particle subunit SRP54